VGLIPRTGQEVLQGGVPHRSEWVRTERKSFSSSDQAGSELVDVGDPFRRRRPHDLAAGVSELDAEDAQILRIQGALDVALLFQPAQQRADRILADPPEAAERCGCEAFLIAAPLLRHEEGQ
jgi:hypothetical protein